MGSHGQVMEQATQGQLCGSGVERRALRCSCRLRGMDGLKLSVGPEK